MKPQDNTTQQPDAPDASEPKTDRKAGLDSEVGDFDNPDADDDEDALPGHVGGGLAGG